MRIFSFSFVFLALVILAGGLSYAILLGSYQQFSDSFELTSMIDMLRMDAGFFLALAFLSWCLLVPVTPYLKIRRFVSVVFIFSLISLSLFSSALVQWTGEAGPMHKVAFYINYLKLPGLNDISFRILVLYLMPALVFISVFVIYQVCIKGSEKEEALSSKFKLSFMTSLILASQACIPVFESTMPRSLSYNPILYFLKTGYFPKSDLLWQQPSNVNFKDAADINTTPLNTAPIKKAFIRGRENKKNVVLIILESFRHDLVPQDQSPLAKVTPFLSELSKESYQFKNAYVSVPHTSKALVGIHCGVLPYLDLPIYESVYGVPSGCLPKILAREGYKSAYFQSPTHIYENRKELIEQFEFESFYSAESFIGSDALRVNLLGYEDKVMLEPAGKWIEENKDHPFLLSFLTGTTHRSYSPPENFEKKQYAKSPLLNDYLNSVRYTDEFVKELFEVFKLAGVYENTLFVIVSDHGEAFREHGVPMHNNILYDEVSKLFLLVHEPGEGFGIVDENVSQTQLVSIILDRLSYQIPVSEAEYMVSDLNTNISSRRDKLVISSCYEKGLCLSLMSGRYKYIYNFNEKPDELYHLEQDAAEQNNIAVSESDRVKEMKSELLKAYGKHQTIYHNYYSTKDREYLKHQKESVIYGALDLRKAVNRIWPN